MPTKKKTAATGTRTKRNTKAITKRALPPAGLGTWGRQVERFDAICATRMTTRQLNAIADEAGRLSDLHGAKVPANAVVREALARYFALPARERNKIVSQD